MTRDQDLINKWVEEMTPFILDFALEMQASPINGWGSEFDGKILERFYVFLSPKMANNCGEWAKDNIGRIQVFIKIWDDFQSYIKYIHCFLCDLFAVALHGCKTGADEEDTARYNKLLDDNYKVFPRKKELEKIFDTLAESRGPFKDEKKIRSLIALGLHATITPTLAIGEERYSRHDLLTAAKKFKANGYNFDRQDLQQLM